MEEFESYGEMIFLSKEAEENFSNLSEGQLDLIAMIIHENIVKTQYKIMEEMNGSK